MNISEENKKKMSEEITKLAYSIKKDQLRISPNMKIKALFYGCRSMQKYIGMGETDRKYWQEKGWLEKERPWKKK